MIRSWNGLPSPLGRRRGAHGHNSGGRRSGSALVEFALVSFVLYVLVAGGIELARMVFVAQALNDAARVAAREMSLSTSATFDDALSQVFDETQLVIASVTPGECNFDGATTNLPLVNRALLPLMIVDRVPVAGGGYQCFLRYPGALYQDGATYRVGIPYVPPRADPAVERIQWRGVIEQIPHASGSAFDNGIAGVILNYPFQAAGLSSFQPSADGQLEPNMGNVNTASDDDVEVDPASAANAPAGAPVDSPAGPASTSVRPYAGTYGLGSQFAFAGRVVRPFRRLISGQAIYRREVIE